MPTRISIIQNQERQSLIIIQWSIKKCFESCKQIDEWGNWRIWITPVKYCRTGKMSEYEFRKFWTQAIHMQEIFANFEELHYKGQNINGLGGSVVKILARPIFSQQASDFNFSRRAFGFNFFSQKWECLQIIFLEEPSVSIVFSGDLPNQFLGNFHHAPFPPDD